MGSSSPYRTRSTSCGFVDELGPTARRMGAVNAVRRLPDGRLLGENFDGAGFVGGLHRRGFSIAGRPSRSSDVAAPAPPSRLPSPSSVLAHCISSNVDPLRASDLARRIREAHPDYPSCRDRNPTGMDMVVNCTSLGMKSGDAFPVELDRWTADRRCRYRAQTEVTPFLARAAASGCATHPGSHMQVRSSRRDLRLFRAQSHFFLTRCEIRSHLRTFDTARPQQS